MVSKPLAALELHVPEHPSMTPFLSWVPVNPWCLCNQVSFWFELDKTGFLSLATNKVLSSI